MNSSPRPLLLRSLLVGCLLWAVGSSLVWADIKKPLTPTVPLAEPAKAVAVRGFPVEIRLEGRTPTGRSLQFITRRQPKHGRFDGPWRLAGKNSDGVDIAILRYVADPASTATTDSFSFATKLEGSGSSEDAEVTIRLVDPAPVLEAPGGVDLGRILAAETMERTITIANQGNAPWKATVPLPAGWSWLVPAGGQFDLPAGEQIEATVRIRVAQEGKVDEQVILRPGSVVRFIGQAAPPFLAYPSLVRLQWDRGKKQRTWRMTVRNNTGAPLTVYLSGPPGLIVPANLTIPLVESVEFEVGWSGDLSRAGAGVIQLEAPGWRQTVNFEAPIAPAAVEITGAAPDGTVDFGVLENAEGNKAVRSFTVSNGGGTASVIRWDPPRLFLLEGLEAEAVVGPGAQRQFTIRPRPDEPGRLKEELLLRMTGGDRLLKLTAEIDPAASKATLMQGQVLTVKPPVATAPAIDAPRAVSGDGLRLRTQILNRGLMEAIPNKDPNLPTAGNVRMILAETKPDQLAFEWDAPGPGVWTYSVRVRMLRNHGLQQAPIPEYDEMKNVKVTATPTGGRAVVTNLRPEIRWTCCIVSFRSDGVATMPTEDLTFFTPPVEESNWVWRLLGAFGAVALVLYVRQKWREDVKWKD